MFKKKFEECQPHKKTAQVLLLIQKHCCWFHSVTSLEIYRANLSLNMIDENITCMDFKKREGSHLAEGFLYWIRTRTYHLLQKFIEGRGLLYIFNILGIFLSISVIGCQKYVCSRSVLCEHFWHLRKLAEGSDFVGGSLRFA